MVNKIIELQSFWVLLIIHLLVLIQITYFRIFKAEKLSRIHISSIKSEQYDKNSPFSSLTSNPNPYLYFPKLSVSVFLKCLKLHHVLIKTFTRNYSLKDRILEVITTAIYLVGVLGITGSEYMAWPNFNFFLAGLLAGTVSRIFHSWYCLLQVKQKSIPNEFSSDSKLARMVEAEVIRRINMHRITRRTLGYFIMILYYLANMYYCVQFLIVFDKDTNLHWSLSFIIAVFFESFVLEIMILLGKIQAVNYLKVGGFDFLESICRMMVTEDFLKTFN